MNNRAPEGVVICWRTDVDYCMSMMSESCRCPRRMVRETPQSAIRSRKSSKIYAASDGCFERPREGGSGGVWLCEGKGRMRRL